MIDKTAREAAARALKLHIEASLEKGSGWRLAAHRGANAAIDAYLAALGDGWPSLSPELIDKLNALASRLTEQGEYEACDLIDTVVARLTPPPGAKP